AKLVRLRVTGWRHRVRAVDSGPFIIELGYGLVVGSGDGIRLAARMPEPAPMANERTRYTQASTNRPAPAPGDSGGRPPSGPGTAGGARCRSIRPAPRSSSARPGPWPHARPAAPPAGSRRPGHRHSSAPRPDHAHGHLP